MSSSIRYDDLKMMMIVLIITSHHIDAEIFPLKPLGKTTLFFKKPVTDSVMINNE